MNDRPGWMATIEQDDADRVLARPCRSGHANDRPAAAAASVGRRLGLEADSTALAGNSSSHSSDDRSISPERAAPCPSLSVPAHSRRRAVRWRYSVSQRRSLPGWAPHPRNPRPGDVLDPDRTNVLVQRSWNRDDRSSTSDWTLVPA
jgi:hypothetical protein